MDWQAFQVSLKLAALTTGILTVFALPLAWWLARSRFRGKTIIEAAVMLPTVLPPSVLGLYLLMLLSSSSPIGRWTLAVFGETLPFSFTGILVGSVVYCLPFAVRPFHGAFSAVDEKLLEASWCLGATRFETFLRIALPLSWPGIVGGMILTFMHTLGEFGVVLLIGGNIPGSTRTLSLSIYDSVQALDMDAANHTALVLVLFSFLTLAVLHSLHFNSRLA